MEIVTTKMSANGQIVIPAEIRKAAKLKPSTKFLIFHEKGNIYLRKVTKEYIRQEIKLLKDIAQGESDIKNGRYLKVDSDLGSEEMLDKIENKKF